MNIPFGTRAAALDIGSNTLKMLVVEKTPDGLKAIAQRTSETRISQGISKATPELSEESMVRAVKVVGELYREMQEHNPAFTRIVATSAVRDASNRSEFQARILAETGHAVDVISGEEEATLIGRGVLTDQALGNQKEIMIFDMGGGSVECIYLKNRQIQVAKSLPLGGVRLLEHHVTNSTLALTESEKQSVIDSVHKQVAGLDIELEDPSKALVVGAGGTYVACRAILANRHGNSLEDSSPYLTLNDLQSIFDEASSYNLEERLRMPKLPPNRADVFPVTLLALITLGRWAGVSQFYHCYHSLRYGVADILLEDA